MGQIYTFSRYSKEEITATKKFFELSQTQMLQILETYLKQQYKTVYATDAYIIAVGDIPIALTAHLDTVFHYGKREIYFDSQQGVMWSPAGLGADDRAGVYSIVQILKQGYRPTIIFTTDEEIGARGASRLVQHFPIPPTDLKYIIELDRQGTNDCVFYDCDNPEFETYISCFGFRPTFGTFSDISIICPRWKVAGVNLSIGYRDEHSPLEVLFVFDMQKTINKVFKMLDDWENADNFEYVSFVSNYDSSNVYKLYSDKWQPISVPYSWTSDIQIKCDSCDMMGYDYEMIPIKQADGTTTFICPDCISTRKDIAWCPMCSEPFVKQDASDSFEILCQDCQKIKEAEING